MTRSLVWKQFFFKSVLPIIAAFLLFCIFKSACTKDGVLNYLWLWILCGLPFGLHRMYIWIIPGSNHMASFISQGLAIFVLGGLIGGFVLVWKLIVAVLYIPVTCFRLITL